MTPRKPFHSARVFLMLLALSAGAAHAADDPGGDEFFEKRIRPILVERCYECHSADKKVKGELRLDSRAGVLKGGKAGAVVVAGDPEKSLLVEAVRYGNPDLQMPPKEKLSDGQIADLVAWVKLGAPDPRVDEAKPAAVETVKADLGMAAARARFPYAPVTGQPVPEVKDRTWSKGEIDQFILHRLEAKGLRPARAADKRTLIRRATYDLTGLPPTTYEVEAFVADESSDAFAKVVDRLLASPAYGQRYARYWLDLVRYTDSFDARVTGGAMDCAEAWRYRDWVVDAFNRDLPYDEFVRRQIAGDLLTEGGERPEGIVATGVYAIGNWGGGDADKEKLLTDIVDDQIDLTGRAFLGLTLACARCHDHKFDPISTKDYYGLAGIFFSSHILPNVGPKTNGPEMLKIPLATPQDLERRAGAKERVAALQGEIDALLDRHYAALAKQVVPQFDQYLLAAVDCLHGKAGKPEAVAAQRGLDPAVVRRLVTIVGGAGDFQLLPELMTNVHGVAGVYAFKPAGKADTPSATINTNAAAASFITIKMPAKSVAVHPSLTGGVGVVFRSPFSGRATVSASAADADPNCGDGTEWVLGVHRLGVQERGKIPNGGRATIAPRELELREGDLVELSILPRAEYSCDTTVVDLRIAEREAPRRTWALAQDLTVRAPARNPAADAYGREGVWSLIDRKNAAENIPSGSSLQAFIAAARDPAEPAGALDFFASQLKGTLTGGRGNSDEDVAVARAIKDPRSWFWSPVRTADPNLPAEVRGEISNLRTQLSDSRKLSERVLPTAHGLQEGGCPGSPQQGMHDVKVHVRGRYDRLGDVVPRGFPRVLAGEELPKISQGSGRAELARWVSSAANPMTARVIVNRLWQWHFGEGIVRTPNNFGKLGTPPTHPELLDWLAGEFVARGWSVKAMHRLIMLSATYLQGASAEPETSKADPDNLLFGRANRRRLDAEGIRDSMLAATGELDPAAGGPAVKDLNSPRRTLYLMTVRSDRTGYRMLFDAADPTGIVDRRTDSTVAPQALFMMNHPFVEARAKKLAAQLAGPDRDRVQGLYRKLFGRPATDDEVALGSRFVGARGDAGWEQYCHALLCSNEFVYVD